MKKIYLKVFRILGSIMFSFTLVLTLALILKFFLIPYLLIKATTPINALFLLYYLNRDWLRL